MRRCDKRAEDEEKSFFEQLLQEGARKLLQAAIENEVMDYIQPRFSISSGSGLRTLGSSPA